MYDAVVFRYTCSRVCNFTHFQRLGMKAIGNALASIIIEETWCIVAGHDSKNEHCCRSPLPILVSGGERVCKEQCLAVAVSLDFHVRSRESVREALKRAHSCGLQTLDSAVVDSLRSIHNTKPELLPLKPSTVGAKQLWSRVCSRITFNISHTGAWSSACSMVFA